MSKGKKYSVKGLLSIASGIPTSKFTTDEAERVLEKLGFKVISVNREQGQRANVTRFLSKR